MTTANDHAPRTDDQGPAHLRGGLLAAPPRHMPTVFTLTIYWWFATMLGFVFIPYLLNRNADSPWSEPQRILLWSTITFASTVHGLMAYLTAHRRGFGPWVFFAVAAPGLVLAYVFDLVGLSPAWGAVLLPASWLVLALIAGKRPLTAPVRPNGFFLALDRLAFVTGNLWFGIAQIVAILVTLVAATLYESKVGGTLGNEAAYARYYNSSWFGTLCLLFFVTLYCATMRKWPFRISQIGWLFVHTGLLVVIVGSLAMFWGASEYRLMLMEGETNSTARSSRHRELHVNLPQYGYRGKVRVQVDGDPAIYDVRQEIPLVVDTPAGKEELRFVIDKALSQAEYAERIVDSGDHGVHADGSGHAGVEVTLEAPMQSVSTILVEGHSERSERDYGLLRMFIRRLRRAEFLEGFGWKYPASELDRGTVAIRSAKGEILAERRVRPGKRDAEPSQGAVVEEPETQLPGGLVARLERWYGFFVENEQGGLTNLFDGSPDMAAMPGLLVHVNGAQGLERYLVVCDGASKAIQTPGSTARYDLRFDYRCRPELPAIPRSFTVALAPDGAKAVVTTNGEGKTTVEPFEIGRAYRFSPDAPIRMTPKKFLDHAEIVTGFEPVRSDGSRVLHAVVSSRGKVQDVWLELSRPTPVMIGGIRMELTYQSRALELPFSLGLLDFREIRYPNSTKPMAYETNLVVRDPSQKLEAARLVDMNHPLDHGGYRFFNSSPIADQRSQKRGVILQVTRNPGYATIIAGSILVSIGIFMVFFVKKSLRRIEQERAVRKAGARSSGVPSSGVPQGV